MTARIARRTAGVVSGCAAALLMFPAFANAAPSDVSISPTVDGSNATVTITNGSGSMIGCNLYGLPADSAVTADTKPVFGYTNPETLSAVIQPGATKTVPLKLFTETGPDGSATLPDGTYDLFWGCSEVPLGEGAEQWGTPTPVGPNATAEPSRLVLPGTAPSTAPTVEPVAPVEPPAQTCFGEICLPPEVVDLVGELWETYATP